MISKIPLFLSFIYKTHIFHLKLDSSFFVEEIGYDKEKKKYVQKL